MKVLRRKILLDDLKRFDDGVSYDTITATSIYMKVEMTQTIDDLGMVTNLPYIDGDVCENFFGFLTTTNITCYNPSSGNPPPPIGAISTYVNGGVPPYTYEWSNGETNASISNLAPGNYSVTVTDANACQITLNDEVLVSENANPTITVTLNRDYYIPGGSGQVGQIIEAGQPIPMSIFNASNIALTLCAGEEVTLTSSEGGAYLWTNGETTQSITINSSDTYKVTVTDSNGCTGDEEITVDITAEELPPLNIEATNIPPTNPNGGPQGDGTVANPYVVCPVSNLSTQDYVQFRITDFSVLNYYNVVNWTSGSQTPIITVYDSSCHFLRYTPSCFPVQLGGPVYETDYICVQYVQGTECSAEGTGEGGGGLGG
jgi:hypothetical protein